MFFYPDEIERILQKVIDNFLIPRFHSEGYRGGSMNATGEWLQNLEVEVRVDSGVIRGRQYSEQLAKGREPGKRPPIAPLEKWVQAKFGLSGREAKSAAFAIAHKIANEGTEYYPSGTSLIEVLEEPLTLEFIENEMSGILRARIAENLIRNAEEILL